MRKCTVFLPETPDEDPLRGLSGFYYMLPEASEPRWSLDTDQLVERSGRSRRWLFAHANELPYVKRISRKVLRGDSVLLERWIGRRP
jgi:hypothetical protein